ncbi:MAG: hypothetical protein CM1200mP7_1170 [Chloroflexota bacterium]|nr:MAG: hypothetical protein CM1200mP7_1170 [Chloroflexota bacterium]
MEREKILLKFQWLTAPYDIDKFAIRISLAMFNTNKEVNHLNDALKKVFRIKSYNETYQCL